MFVTDYSAARPGGARLASAGCIGAIRYAAAGRRDVNVTRAEVTDLKAHGLDVGIVNEHEANYMLFRSGSECAFQAEEIAGNAGLPRGVTWFAMDFDATNGGPTRPGSPGDQNMTKIARFLTAAAGAIGEQNVGGYGSYFALEWLHAHLGFRLAWEWQTEAWSYLNGQLQIWPSIRLFQHARASTVPGCDLDSTVFADWGQRRAAPPTPGKNPARFDYLLTEPVIGVGFPSRAEPTKTAQKALNAVVVPHFTPLGVDGDYGPKTAACVTQYQINRRLYRDGITGKQTWTDLRVLLLERGTASL